jgi:hypothetical protein
MSNEVSACSLRMNEPADPISPRIGVMFDQNDELKISACARGEFEACLERERI